MSVFLNSNSLFAAQNIDKQSFKKEWNICSSIPDLKPKGACHSTENCKKAEEKMEISGIKKRPYGLNGQTVFPQTET